MEDWRIQALGVVDSKSLAGQQVNGDRRGQFRVGALMETWVRKEGESGSVLSEFHDIEVVTDSVDDCNALYDLGDGTRLADWCIAVYVDCRRQNLPIREAVYQLAIAVPIGVCQRTPRRDCTRKLWFICPSYFGDAQMAQVGGGGVSRRKGDPTPRPDRCRSPMKRVLWQQTRLRRDSQLCYQWGVIAQAQHDLVDDHATRLQQQSRLPVAEGVV